MAFKISSAPFFLRCLHKYLITLPSMNGIPFFMMNSVGWMGIS